MDETTVWIMMVPCLLVGAAAVAFVVAWAAGLFD